MKFAKYKFVVVSAISIFAGILIASGLNWTACSKADRHGSSEISHGVIPISNPGSAPLITESGESPFVAVASKVLPTVVNIRTKKLVQSKEHPEFRRPGTPFDDMFKDFFRDMFPKDRVIAGQGSGIIIDRKGLLLTNNHVVSNRGELTIRLWDGKEVSGEVIGADPRTDIAVVKLKIEKDLDHSFVATLGNSDDVKVGDWAIAVGNPFSMRGELNGTVTVGVISAKGRTGIDLSPELTYQDFIQTDASINPGNSGGPLVNIRGEVIGINTAIESPFGGNIGIGFAVPINLAKKISKELIEKGKIVRGFLGIVPTEVSSDMVSDLGLKSNEGVGVTNVQPGSPADKGGLQDGDVIIKFDGKRVIDVPKFRLMVAETPPGKEVELVIVRDRKEKVIRVKLGEMPGAVALRKEVEKDEGWLGIKVASLTDPSIERYGLKEKEGVVVVDVKVGSPAYDSGIREGDVIKKISTHRISSLKDYTDAMRALKSEKKSLVFLLKRQNPDGNVVSLFLAVKPKT